MTDKIEKIFKKTPNKANSFERYSWGYCDVRRFHDMHTPPQDLKEKGFLKKVVEIISKPFVILWDFIILLWPLILFMAVFAALYICDVN